MKKFLTLILFFTLSIFAKESIPLQKMWQSKGLCLNVEIKRDYIDFAGKDIYGTVFNCSKQKDIDIKEFQSFIDSLQFTTVYKDEEKVIAKKALDKNSILWIKFDKDDENPLKALLKKIYYIDDKKELLIEDNEKYFFYIKHPGNRYLSVEIDLPNKESSLLFEAELEEKYKKLKTSFFYNKRFYGKYSTKHLLLDLPQTEGEYLIKISFEGECPAKISVSINEEGKLPKIEKGDKLGGILLKNIPYGKAKVLPEGDIRYSHPAFSELNYLGDRTPDSNAIFWLPKGFWKLKIDSLSKDSVNESYAHLIPVYPGRLTEVDWPLFFTKQIKKDDEISLEIIKSKLKKERGFVDFSLLNLKEKIEPKNMGLEIIEAGSKAYVEKVEKLITSPEIVILLDSSGSMKKSMKAALKATSDFIKRLPQNSKITLIDFDTKPKILATGNKEKILKSLKKVKANGATALYDALAKGIDILKKSNRPTIILFTDGKDSNYNDTGPGSKITQDEIFEKIKNTEFPIFTIGFGKSPDIPTLSRIASLTGAKYYSAKRIKNLKEVFESINKNIGNQYRAYFKRPEYGKFSSKPVLSLMIDNSGSMEERMERVREVLRDFIKKLPEDFLVQISIFSNDIEVKQVLSQNRSELIRAISEMKPLDATNILGSIEQSYKFLHNTPSSNRYLIYLTDEAIDVPKKDKITLNTLLGKLKDDGIKTFWIGMTKEDKKSVFEKVAKASNGEYVLVKDSNDLEKILISLNERLNRPIKSDEHILRVNLTYKDPFGRTSLFSDAVLVKEKLPIKESDIAFEGIRYIKGERLKTYDKEISKFVTGEDIIGKESIVTKKIPLNIAAKNQAVKIELKEAIFLSRFRGVDAPDNKRFMAIRVSFENILPPQEVIIYPDGSAHPSSWVSGASQKNAKVVKKIPDYLIPDAKMHIFLRWNNTLNLPISDATYLAQTPLIIPEEREIFVKAKEKVEGTLIFVVPNSFMKQSSIHFYDTAYGHIDIPISGIIKVKKESIEKLPKSTSKRLSDTFSLKIDGIKKDKKIENFEANEKNILLTVFGSLSSKVQAHLSIKPKDRFYLAIKTKKGDYFFKMHPITKKIPFGFYEPRFVTPGSFNKIAMVFEIPKALEKYPKKLFVDILDNPVNIEIDNKNIKKNERYLAKDSFEDSTLYINGIYFAKEVSELPNNTLIVDFSVENRKDKNGASLSNFISLSFTKEAKKRLKDIYEKSKKSAITNKGLGSFGYNRLEKSYGDITRSWADEYLLSFGAEFIVFDGEKRRAYAFFELPEKTKPTDFMIVSSLFKNINLPIKKYQKFQEISLLSKKSEYQEDDEFKNRLYEVLAKIEAIRKANNFIKPGSFKTIHLTLSGTKPSGIEVDPPSLLVKREEFENLSDLQKYLKNIELIPSNDRAWRVYFSPEAVFTQKYATENEIAYMAEKILNKNSFETKRLVVSLNDKGKKEVKKFFKDRDCKLFELPALKYEDENGKSHTIIFPFFKEKWQTEKLIDKIEEASEDNPQIDIEISIKALKLSSSSQESLSEISTALSGEDSDNIEEISIYDKKIDLKDIGLDPIEIGFLEVYQRGKGKVVKAFIDSAAKKELSKDVLELTKYKPLSVKIKFYTPQKEFETVRELKKEISLKDMIFIFGINLPDIPKDSLEKLEAKYKKRYKEAKNPDTYSSIKWMGRVLLARFIGAQTEYEKELSKKLNLKIDRVKSTRIIGVTLYNFKKPVVTFDLINPYPNITGEKKSKKSFNIMSGLFYTHLEGEIIPDSVNAFKIWSMLPKNSEVLFIDSDYKDLFIEMLKKQKYPMWMIEHFKDSDNYILFPSIPAKIGSKYITAWLEIDPNSFKLFSYLSSGERGMSEYLEAEDAQAVNQYIEGFWMGVQVSVWATASYSLILSDYEKIKKYAKDFALKLAKNANKIFEYPQKADISKQIENYADMADIIGFSSELSLEDFTSDNIKDIKENMKEKYLGFENGFKDGVEWYFKK